MDRWQSDVKFFHEKFGIPILSQPSIPSEERKQLRQSLIQEEYMELMGAMDDQNMPEIADAMADLIYVILGTALEYGVDLDPIWKEVQMSNMRKEGGAKNELGKLLKPPGWTPPDVYTKLVSQGWRYPKHGVPQDRL